MREIFAPQGLIFLFLSVFETHSRRKSFLFVSQCPINIPPSYHSKQRDLLGVNNLIQGQFLDDLQHICLLGLARSEVARGSLELDPVTFSTPKGQTSIKKFVSFLQMYLCLRSLEHAMFHFEGYCESKFMRFPCDSINGTMWFHHKILFMEWKVIPCCVTPVEDNLLHRH